MAQPINGLKKIIRNVSNTAPVAIQNTYSTLIRECQEEREYVGNIYLNEKLLFVSKLFLYICTSI